MILIDFSSTIHRMVHYSFSHTEPKKDGSPITTDDFIGTVKYFIFQELFGVKQEFGAKFGDIVICLDEASKGYWRRDVYPGYKAERKKDREKSDINFSEVFNHMNKLIEQLEQNLPWKVVSVNRAEADDAMLVLAREYNQYENVLIYSPDKDMIQAQRDNETVFQYSPKTKKWLVPENKHNHMEHWILEHVCLGDKTDGVPRVVDHTEFSATFLKYLKNNDVNFETPIEFRVSDIPAEKKKELLIKFDVYKTNRKGESTGIKDIYKDMRFSPTLLTKSIVQHGGLDGWLDSHPLYRKHYDRNFTLVMEEGIPVDIWNQLVVSYKEAKTDYNDKEFEKYLIENGLKSIIMDLPSVFKINRKLTAEDFDW